MPIRYAEITVILEETIARSIWLLTCYEVEISNIDTIIVKFDDDDRPYHTKQECERQETTRITFSDTILEIVPLHFYTDNDTKYTLKLATNGILNTNILRQNEKFKTLYDMLSPSKYNMIYCSSSSQDSFGICRVKSNEMKPRFVAAYDDKKLGKQDVLYLIHNLFTKQFLNF